jgi:hypothetical protein
MRAALSGLVLCLASSLGAAADPSFTDKGELMPPH